MSIPNDTVEVNPNAMARHIAGVAARLFAAKGYDATSVRDIVEASAVTKPTLYYHFGSKQGLAEALVSRPLTELVERLKSLVEAQTDPIDVAAAVLESQFAFCREDSDRARMVYAVFFGPRDSALSGELSTFAETVVALLMRAVGRLVDAGLVDRQRQQSFVQALRGMAMVHTLDALYRDRELESGLARQIVEDLLQGYAPRKTLG